MSTLVTLLLASLSSASAGEATDSLASQIKRGLVVQAPKTHEIEMVCVRLFPEVVKLSKNKLELMLQQEEWLAVGIIETKDHGRLRMTCHADRCVASSEQVSIELMLVKAGEPTPAPKRKAK